MYVWFHRHRRHRHRRHRHRRHRHCLPACLQGTTYKAPFSCDLVYQVEGLAPQRLAKRLGSLPIMLKSRACYLRNLGRRDLVARKVRVRARARARVKEMRRWWQR